MATKKRPNKLAKSSIFTVPYVGYPFTVLVVIGANDSELADALDERGVEFDASDVEQLRLPFLAKGQTVMLGCGWTVLRMAAWTGSISNRADLAHEIFHAVEFMFRRIGIKLCAASHEAYAYAITNLTREILTRMAMPHAKRNEG